MGKAITEPRSGDSPGPGTRGARSRTLEEPTDQRRGGGPGEAGQPVGDRPTSQQSRSQQPSRQEDVFVRRSDGPARNTRVRQLVGAIVLVVLVVAGVFYVVGRPAGEPTETTGQAQDGLDLQAEKEAILAGRLAPPAAIGAPDLQAEKETILSDRGATVSTTTEDAAAIAAEKANLLTRTGQRQGTVGAAGAGADKGNALARDRRTMNAVVQGWATQKLIG